MKTQDLYTQIAQAEGVERSVVKSLAESIMTVALVPKDHDLKTELIRIIRLNKSFLKMEESNDAKRNGR